MPWEYFLWRFPLHRALDFEHQSLHLAGVGTRWAEERIREEKAARDFVDRIKALRGR